MRMKLRKINNNVVLGACVLVMMALCILSVAQPIIFQKRAESRAAEVRARLAVIQQAEEKYKERHGVYTGDFATLVKGKYLKAEDQYIPYSGGKKFSLAATTIVGKSGKQIPMMECGATYAEYLDGLDEEAIEQATAQANYAGNYPGIKIGDITAGN